MSHRGLRKFSKMLRTRREDVMAHWRQRLHDIPAARRLDPPTLDDHVDLVLDDLSEALQIEDARSIVKLPIGKGPRIHGLQRLKEGFDLLDVVAEYNLIRETLLEFAEKENIRLGLQVNVILNRVVDKAIAVAVQTYGDQKALQIQQNREEHFSFIVHDLKTPLSAIATAANIVERSLADVCKDDRISAMIAIVQRNARHLNTLVSKILGEQSKIVTSSGKALHGTAEKRQKKTLPPPHQKK